MKALVLTEFGQPLQQREVPDPEPTNGRCLIEVRAIGICGTDLKITSGSIPGLRTPLIPGHEVSGVLVEDAGDLRAGQRVAAFIFQPCGQCGPCGRGDETLCLHSPRIGFERDGGLATYLLMRPEDLVPFGAGLPFAKAAVTMDAVLSPWHALHTRAGLKAADKVVVIGAGGLGLHAVMIARAAGAQVAVVDPAAPNRERAIDLGAQIAVHPDTVASLATRANDGADICLEASGSPEGFRTATAVARPGGTIVCCGYKPGADYATDSLRLAMAELRIVGSRGGTREDARAALSAVEHGAIEPLIADEGSLDDVNGYLDRLRAGTVVGRLIAHVS